MYNLLMSVSDVRGIYSDGFKRRNCSEICNAFGTLNYSLVVVGRDSRNSGETLTHTVILGLRKAETDVVNLMPAKTFFSYQYIIYNINLIYKKNIRQS